MAEITIKWNNQEGGSCWDGITDTSAETVCDLLNAVEGAEDALDREELETLLQVVDRAIFDITLAVRAARKKK